MRIRVKKQVTPYILLAAFLLLIPALGLLVGRTLFPISRQPTPTNGILVDPLFKEFYATLGGEDLLGRPLTALFERDGQRCQFTDAHRSSPLSVADSGKPGRATVADSEKRSPRRPGEPGG